MMSVIEVLNAEAILEDFGSSRKWRTLLLNVFRFYWLMVSMMLGRRCILGFLKLPEFCVGKILG